MPERIVVAQNRSPELTPGDFNLLCQRDFLLAIQKRNLAHLREIQTDRIAGHRSPRCGACLKGWQVRFGILTSVDAQLQRLERTCISIRDRSTWWLAAGNFRRLDDFDSDAVEGNEQLIEFLGRAGFVRKVIADLLIRQITLIASQLDELTKVLC